MSYSQLLSIEETKELWNKVCQDLKPQLTPAAFSTWILANPLTEVKILENNQALAIISTLTAFHATNIKKNLYSQLKTSLEKNLNKTIDLDFQVKDPGLAFQQKQKNQKDVKKTSKKSDIPASFSLNFQETNRKNNISADSQTVSPTVEELFSIQTIKNSLRDRSINAARRIGLKLDYTFNTFAVSTTNEMAHAAAHAVSKSPGTAYNPLFLYGGVGVGKTHLVHAIAHNILKNNPETNVIYCTGEEFTNNIIQAIQTKKALSFKSKFRNAQILLIDDIQFIAGKTAVQEEFFHTFNALIKLQSQIVLTSDRAPAEINLMEDRLKSRFEAGLMIDIQQPTLELRTAIVLIKSKANQLTLPMDLAQLVANKIDSARRIEGIINQIRSRIELNHETLSQAMVEDVLNKESQSKKNKLRIKPQIIIKKVADFYHLNPMAVKGLKRQKELVKARHIAMYLLKKECQLSLVEIGKWFDGRDHTSVIHAFNKIEHQIKTNNILYQDVSEITRGLIKLAA